MSIVNLLVEGNIDEAIARKVIAASGHTFGTTYGKRGFGYIKTKISGFNRAAVGTYCLSLVDLMDTQLPCPTEVIQRWLPSRSQFMLFRVVIQEAESWVLGDKNNIAEFLKVRIGRIPDHPEQISDPKRMLVNLARGSRSSKIRSALVPEEGSTAQVGKLYTAEVVNFVRAQWDIEKAREKVPSLDRCLRQLESIS